MAKHAVEDRIDALAALDLGSAGAVDHLREALKDRNNLVVAKAARLVLKGRVEALSEAMEERLARLMEAGMAADRGCEAKRALAEALYELGTGSEETFLTGARYVQMEPVFGGTADSAAVFRGTCAMGLVRVGSRAALAACADLLGDPEQQARIMGARALAYCGGEAAAIALRVKLRCGDALAEVMGECFAALLSVTPREAVALTARFLADEREEVAAEAAMALGSARGEGGYEALRRWWDENPGSGRREMMLVPLALTRRSEAVDLLVELVAEGPTVLACGAAEALGAYRGDEAVRTRVLAAAGREVVRRAFLAGN